MFSVNKQSSNGKSSSLFKKVIQRGCCCTLQQRANCDVFGGNEEVPFEKSSMKRQIYGSSNSTPAFPDTATQTTSHLHVPNFVIYNKCLYMLKARPPMHNSCCTILHILVMIQHLVHTGQYHQCRYCETSKHKRVKGRKVHLL